MVVAAAQRTCFQIATRIPLPLIATPSALHATAVSCQLSGLKRKTLTGVGDMNAGKTVRAALGVAAVMGTFAMPAAAAGLDGAYVFGGLGYTQGNLDFTYNYSTGNNVSPLKPKGAMISGGIGRKVSEYGKWTIGVEADLSVGAVRSGYVHLSSTPCITPGESCRSTVNWMASGRVVAEMDAGATKPFATFGVAFAGLRASADTGACGSAPCDLNGMRGGWIAGVGLRHEIKPGLSLRGEVLYSDFGTNFFSTAGVKGSFKYTTVRIGLQKQF